MRRYSGSRTAGRIAFGIVASGLLVLGGASAASAEEIVIENVSTDPEITGLSICNDEEIGQSFTATASGSITTISVIRSASAVTATLNIYEGEGLTEPAASQQVDFPDIVADWSTFSLDSPYPVTAGSQYTFAFDDARTCENGEHFYASSGYDGGVLFADDTPYQEYDLMFRVVVETEVDTDEDGVIDALDRCPETVFSTGPSLLKANHVWSTSSAGFRDRTGGVLYTLADTAGCSSEQIIAAGGLAKGLVKHGVPTGEIDDWIASLE